MTQVAAAARERLLSRAHAGAIPTAAVEPAEAASPPCLPAPFVPAASSCAAACSAAVSDAPAGRLRTRHPAGAGPPRRPALGPECGLSATAGPPPPMPRIRCARAGVSEAAASRPFGTWPPQQDLMESRRVVETHAAMPGLPNLRAGRPRSPPPSPSTRSRWPGACAAAAHPFQRIAAVGPRRKCRQDHHHAERQQPATPDSKPGGTRSLAAARGAAMSGRCRTVPMRRR